MTAYTVFHILRATKLSNILEIFTYRPDKGDVPAQSETEIKCKRPTSRLFFKRQLESKKQLKINWEITDSAYYV